MMTAFLRRCAHAAIRLLPGRHRARLGAELARTIEALADDARRQGQVAAERRYLLRELRDIVRQAWVLRQADRPKPGAVSQRLLDALRDDLRASLRQCRRRPVATFVVIGTLAIAVAAVTTTFGLAAAVLWRPLPFPDAGQLVFVWETASDERGPFRVTGGRYAVWEREARAFASLALFGAAGFSLDDAEGSRPIRGVRVSASYFDTLGLRPRLGRGFEPADEVPGRHRVLILSESTWRSRFGADPGILARTIRLSGEPYEVVGVMPDTMTPGWPSNPARVGIDRELRELWVPIPRTPELATNMQAHVFGVLGRLRSGVSRHHAEAELNAMRATDGPDHHTGVTSAFRDQFVGDVRAPLMVLLAASLAVLLVACANLAALQVSLFEQRRGDLGMRIALGAGRARLLGLLAIDAALPAVAGAATGWWLSSVALAWIPGQLPPSMPFVTPPRIDGVAALFVCGLALLITTALSAWPAARLWRLSPAPRGAVLPRRGRAYRAVVAAQVAVGVALAVPASLLGQSLASLRARETGFFVEGVLVTDVTIRSQEAASLARVAGFERVLRDAAATVPGARGVALAYDHPLEANWTEVVSLRGEVASDPSTQSDAQLRIVSPSYFDALGVQVVDGRPFDDREDPGAPGVVVVNEAFAAAHGGRMIGRRLRSSAASYAWGAAVPGEYEIVGVVENERVRGLDVAAAPAVYVSTRQFPQPSAVLLLRTDRGAAASADLRAAIRRAAPDATIGQTRALDAILAEQLTSRRVTAEVAGGFAVAAVGLAVLGLYGLLAVAVASRTRDVGVRLALGASPSAVARAVVVDSLQAAGAGICAGAVLALGIGRLVEHLLVDVSAYDLRTLVAVVAAVFLAAVLAAFIPALRAARTDPVVALRAE